MNEIGKLIFTKRDYGNDTTLYLKVAQQLQLLLETGNICTVYDGDGGRGTVVIEFTSNNPLEGQPYPYYLYPDEAEYVLHYHDKKLRQEYLDKIKEIDNGNNSNNNSDSGMIC